jgi:hypothetical protein
MATTDRLRAFGVPEVRGASLIVYSHGTGPKAARLSPQRESETLKG